MLLAAGPVMAASDIWTGATDAFWANANWVGTPNVPGTGDTATFGGADSGLGNNTIDLGGGVTIHSILFDQTGPAYAIGTGAAQVLTLNNNGTITMNSTVTNNQAIDATVLLGDDGTAQPFTITNNSTSNGLSIAGNITGSAGAGIKTLTVTGSGNTGIGGIIGDGSGGTVALAKSDTGTLTLSGPNTFSGGATLNTGKLVLGNASALGATAGTFVINGGTLDSSVANLVNANNNPQTWNNSFTFLGSQNLDLGTGAIFFTNNVTLTVPVGSLTVGGNITVSGNNKNLTETGPGMLILKGNNILNPGSDQNGGAITIQSGGTLFIAAGTTSTQGTGSTNRGYGPMNVGTATSGGNTLIVTGGKAYTGSLVIGQGTSGSGTLYGQNTVLISTPGNSGSPTYKTGTNSGNYYVGVYSSSNSLTISNGAYVQQNNGGGTSNSYVGQYAGSDYNTMTITGANTQFVHGGQRMYVGGDGSHNSLLVQAGGQVTSSLRMLTIGGNSNTASFNSVTVDGTGAVAGATVVNATQRLWVGFTANSTDNYLLVENGATYNGTNSQTSSGGMTIGNAAGANNNYITVTGATSILNLTSGAAAADLVIGNNATADNNHLNVNSGATANLTIPVILGGTNSKINLGDGTGTSTINLGSPTSLSGSAYSINLSNADSVLKFNKGQLTAGRSSVASAQLVYGSGQVQLAGDGSVSVYSGNTRSIDVAISGIGSLTKEGAGTLDLTALNSYSGDTIINNGTLVNNYADLSNNAGLTVGSFGWYNLNFTGTDTIAALTINGSTGLTGFWGSSLSGAPHTSDFLLGNGWLEVVPPTIPFNGSATWNSSLTTSTSSSWNSAPNWFDGSGVPGVDSPRPGTAIFSGSGSVVAIDLAGGINPNLKALSFSNSGYTLSGGSLTLDNGPSGTATVTVLSGTQTIGTIADPTVLTLASSASVDIAAASELKIAANIGESGSLRSLTKLGSGTLVLSGTNNYTGGTVVNAGILAITSSSALPDNQSLTVGAGGTLIFDPSFSGSPVQSASPTMSAVAPVPEPGTLALLIAGLVGLGAWRRGKK